MENFLYCIKTISAFNQRSKSTKIEIYTNVDIGRHVHVWMDVFGTEISIYTIVEPG